MLRVTLATATLFFFTSTVNALVVAESVVDFSDGIFTTVEQSSVSDEPVIFSETAGGVTFTLESTINLVGVERFLDIEPGIPSPGLKLGGGAGSTLEFTLMVDHDVQLQSYSTDTGGTPLGNPTFDITGGGLSVLGNSLTHGVAFHLFSLASVTLEAGELYTFDIQNTGAAVQTWLKSINFVPVNAVPVPAAYLFLATGLLGIRLFKRR